MAAGNDLTSQRLYHGTKADLKPGDLIDPGHSSNYGSKKTAAYVYLTATLEAATWGAELALGEGRGRIYIVEPTGAIEDDPNLTDRGSRGIRRSRTGPRIRFGSRAKCMSGRVTAPKNSRPCTITSSTSGNRALRQSRTEPWRVAVVMMGSLRVGVAWSHDRPFELR